MHPEELFDANGTLVAELRELAPTGTRRMSANPHANGGAIKKALRLPDFRQYGLKIEKPGNIQAENTRPLGNYLRDVMKQNMTNFRVFGPDALDLSPDDLAAVLAGNTGRIKTVITDQKVIAGIGNAYSDEILHVAKISPFATAGKLSDEQLSALHDAMISVLTDAVSSSVGQGAAMLKGEKRSGLRVHARTGLPCPVCGDTVREVSFADKSFQYCPTCQTGGKVLADRRMSRLLK